MSLEMSKKGPSRALRDLKERGRWSLRPTLLRVRLPSLTLSTSLTSCWPRNSITIPWPRVNPSISVGFPRLPPSSELVELVVFRMALCSDSVPRSSMKTQFPSIQSQRCKDVPLRSWFSRLSSGTNTSQKRSLVEPFSLPNTETSVMPSRICSRLVPSRFLLPSSLKRQEAEITEAKSRPLVRSSWTFLATSRLLDCLCSAWHSNACSRQSSWAASTSKRGPYSGRTVAHLWIKSTSQSSSATTTTIRTQTRLCSWGYSMSGYISFIRISSTSRLTLMSLRRSRTFHLSHNISRAEETLSKEGWDSQGRAIVSFKLLLTLNLRGETVV